MVNKNGFKPKNMIQRALDYKHSINGGRQTGAIASYILAGIVGLGIVGGAVSYMSRDKAVSMSAQQAEADAVTIVKQASDVREAFFRYIADGNNPPDDATVDAATVATTGLFSEANNMIFSPSQNYGLFPRPKAKNALQTAYLVWDYAAVSVPGIGSPTGKEVVGILNDVSGDVCRRLNKTLWNTSAKHVPFNAGTATAGSIDLSGVTDINTGFFDQTELDGTTAAAQTAKIYSSPEGCVKNGATYIYYKVLYER